MPGGPGGEVAVGECWCADYDCAGECCGFGNCMCSTDRDDLDDDAGHGDDWVPVVVDAPDISTWGEP